MNRIFKKYFIIFLTLTFFSFSTFASNGDLALEKNDFDNKPHHSKNYVENEVIVKYKEDIINLKTSTGKLKAQSLEKEKNIRDSEEIEDMNIALIKSEKSTEELIEELKNDPSIEYVEPNYILTPAQLNPNDPYFSEQWYLPKVEAPSAWESDPALTNTTIVAVIDSGVNYDHEDIALNMWDGSASCRDEFNNIISGGCPNHGWNYILNNNDPMDVYNVLDPNNGHGTFVAGIVAARTNNSIGMSGLSYNNKIKIMALRFNFSVFQEVKAINFAKNNGAKIINASYLGSSYSQSEKDAIDSFGGVFIAAAGNGGGDNIGDDIDDVPVYPAGHTSSNIISIASTSQSDALSYFSNYGTTSVDVAAPGESLRTLSNQTNSSYRVASGTSGAAPIVAGIAAVLYQKDPTLAVSEIKNILMDSGDTKTSLVGKTVSGKRVNFNNALLAVSGTPQQVATPTASPPAGTYASAQSVTLSTSTSGSTIRYTTNGTTPTSSSTLYSSPITISSSITLRARAFKSGMTDSDVMTATYTINSQISYPASVHRYSNIDLGAYFYTSSIFEKNDLDQNGYGFSYQGIGFYAFDHDVEGTSPVYRFANRDLGIYFFTTSIIERDYLMNNDPGFEYQGIGFYAYNYNKFGTVPVYRFANRNSGFYFYTSSIFEKNDLIENSYGFEYQGVGFYVPIN
jgi:subtilisin family serine protease